MASTKQFAHDLFRPATGPGSRSAKPGPADSMQMPEMKIPAGSTGGAPLGLMELWKNKDWKGMMKHPGGMLAGLMLAQFIYGHLKGKVGGAFQEGLQQDVIEQQAGMSEEDAYYQAALPGLTQERQMAQQALMQAILGGGQQAVQVPGERRI